MTVLSETLKAAYIESAQPQMTAKKPPPVVMVDFNGTMADITPEGNVTAYTDKVRFDRMPAPDEDLGYNGAITIGPGFNSVAAYAARVSMGRDGVLDIYTAGKFEIKKPSEASPVLEIETPGGAVRIGKTIIATRIITETGAAPKGSVKRTMNTQQNA